MRTDCKAHDIRSSFQGLERSTKHTIGSSSDLDSGPLGWPPFRCRTAPGQHPLPIWRKLVPRKSRLETKANNEARSALLARLW